MKIVKKTKVSNGRELPCAKSNILYSAPNEANTELIIWYVESVEDYNGDEGYDTA